MIRSMAAVVNRMSGLSAAAAIVVSAHRHVSRSADADAASGE